MLSIAAIDARCFLEPRETTPASDLDWAWPQTRLEREQRDAGPTEASGAMLNSLIRRHFVLAAA